MLTIQNIIDAMERIAPPALALDGDPIGLHAGRPSKRASRAILALDASLTAIKKAFTRRADILIVHHPRFFKGLTTLSEHDPSGRRASAIARSGLAVYSAHTNLDIAPGGVNDALAATVGIVKPAVLKPERKERLLKLAVFVPASHIDKVREAVCTAGAGAIGDYSDCTFSAQGIGTFRGGAATNPFIGKPGILEATQEFRLETVFGENLASKVLSAMRRVHPYEEVAYDLYQVEGHVEVFGLGRIGSLESAETLSHLANRLALATGSRMTQFAGKPGRKIARIATWAGGGVDVKSVLASEVDALVAGEVGYHDIETFSDNDISVITLGHGHSESVVLKPLAARLRKEFPGLKVDILPPDSESEIRNCNSDI